MSSGARRADRFESSHRARDPEHVSRRGRSRWLPAATYAQRIKTKTTKGSKTRKSAPRAAAKAASAAPKPAPAAAPQPVPAPPSVTSGELQRLKDELQRINQEISRLARASRPDAARQTHLPEKQELLRQKADLDGKIRTASKS